MASRPPFSAKQVDYFQGRVNTFYNLKLEEIIRRYPLQPSTPEELVAGGLVPPKGPSALNELRAKIDLTKSDRYRYSPKWEDIFDVESYLKRHKKEIETSTEKRSRAIDALDKEKTRVLDQAYLAGSDLAAERHLPVNKLTGLLLRKKSGSVWQGDSSP